MVTGGSVTWHKQLLTTACLLMALVPSPDIAALSLWVVKLTEPPQCCCFETLNLFLTCGGVFFALFCVFLEVDLSRERCSAN